MTRLASPGPALRPVGIRAGAIDFPRPHVMRPNNNLSTSAPALRPSAWFPFAAFVCMVGLCAIEAWRPLTAGSDFWFHAAIGGWIWRHGDVPRQTLYLWSAHIPWVYHSWLSEPLLYWFMRLGGVVQGPRLALVALVLLVAATFSVPWSLWRRQGPVTWLTALVFLLAIHGGNQRFQARPEALSAFYFAVLLVFLVRWREVPADFGPGTAWRTWRTWGLVGFFVLWANSHPAFVSGLLVLTLTAACDFFQERGSPRSKTLLTLVPICFAAANLNPYTWHLWGATGHLHSLAFQSIGEWRPVYHVPMEPLDLFAGQAVCVVIAVLAWFRSERRYAQLAWLLFLTAGYVVARRNAELCGLTALVVMAASARELDPGRWMGAEMDKLRRGWLGAGVVVAYAVLMWVLRPDPRFPGAVVPVRLADFVKSVPPSVPVFNDYNDSDYLEYRCQDAPPLFVDAVNAYPDSVFGEYLDVINLDARGRALLAGKRYGVIALAQQPGDTTTLALENYLASDHQWQLLFSSYEGTVWGNEKYLVAPSARAGVGHSH